MNVILITFVMYIVGMAIVGIIAARFTRNIEDFSLGGRRLGPWVIAISAKATDFSTWLLVGLPGKAFTMGLGAIWAVIGCFGGTLFNWTVIAQRLRRFTKRVSAITVPDYFEARFNDHTHVLRITAMVMIVVFFTLYISAQCVGTGKILAGTFNITPIQGMAYSLGFIIFYTMVGGFLAEAWTDFVQGWLMLGGLSILSIVGVIRIGGIGSLVEGIRNINPTALSWGAGETGLALFLGVVLGGLAIGLGYPGQPHIVIRYMAIRKTREMPKATWIAMIWTTLALLGAIGVGMVGMATTGDLADPETVTTALAQAIFPAWLVGIIIAAATAAMMSTVDSQLLVAATAIAEDTYGKLLNRKASPERLLLVARISTVVIGAVAFFLGIRAEKLVYDLVLYAWGGLAASFGPALILSLRWPRITKWGAFAGMVIGAATVVIWENVERLESICYELIPAFFLSLLVIVVVSLLEKKPEMEMVRVLMEKGDG
jgi:sodium/proline symporter